MEEGTTKGTAVTHRAARPHNRSPAGMPPAGKRGPPLQFRQTPKRMRGGRRGMASPATMACRSRAADASADSSRTVTSANRSERSRSGSGRLPATVAASCRARRWQRQGCSAGGAVSCARQAGQRGERCSSAGPRRQQDAAPESRQQSAARAWTAGATTTCANSAAQMTSVRPNCVRCRSMVPSTLPGDARAAGHRGQTTIANGRRAAVGPAAAGRTVSGRPAAHAGMGMLNTRRSPAPGRRDSPGSGAVRIGRTPSRAGPRGS